MSAALFFALKTILAKLAYLQGAAPLELLALRMLVAGSIFGAIAGVNLARGRWKLDLSPKQWALILLLGVGGYYLCSFLDFAGLYYIDASLGRMILFLYPTLVVLINAFLAKSAISRSTLLALFVSYAGLFLMVSPNLKIDPDLNFWKGSSLVFLSALIYAFYLTGVDWFFRRAPMAFFISITMLVSTAAVLVNYALVRDFSALFALNGEIYVYALLLGVFATVIPVYAMSLGIALIGASKAAMYNMIGPIATLIMGAVFLSERLGPVEIMGMALILLGVTRIRG
jgi:drug/metabolite transporter (DMT)-like permease